MADAEPVGPGADDFGNLDGLAFIDRFEDRARFDRRASRHRLRKQPAWPEPAVRRHPSDPPHVPRADEYLSQGIAALA